ncbi:MAG TPA: hypothetical protein VFM05_10060 [Candidatus Saccharimonadales bacterium]|nr:hypothetical protein [Candidatus Saccharimonadales bacterium]
MTVLCAIKSFFIGTFVAAVLSLLPVAATTSASNADIMMQEQPTSQSCAAACTSSFTMPVSYVSQRVQEEQEKDPPIQAEPYYAQFNRFYEPQKIAANTPSAYVLRPPDIIKLTMNYRS